MSKSVDHSRNALCSDYLQFKCDLLACEFTIREARIVARTGSLEHVPEVQLMIVSFASETHLSHTAFSPGYEQ
jgi:hypothetical protein